MASFTNTLLEALSSTVAALGESKLIEVLQQLHDKDKSPDKAQYKSVLQGGLSFVTGIGGLAAKTKTKLDDAMLEAIKEAIETSAAANGVNL